MLGRVLSGLTLVLTMTGWGPVRAYYPSVRNWGSCGSTFDPGDIRPLSTIRGGSDLPARLYPIPLARTIASCSAVISSAETRKMWPDELAFAYLIRGSAYDRGKEYDQAIADYRAAMETLRPTEYAGWEPGIARRIAQLEAALQPPELSVPPAPAVQPNVVERPQPSAGEGGATIKVEAFTEDGRKTTIISIDGGLMSGDERRFADVAISASDAVVVLSSPGGDLIAGIEIGKAIHLKGFATLVLDDSMCASACALAWLGGRKRLMAPRAQIGFHAAFLSDPNQSVTSVGNALVGAYANELNLSPDAIAYMTREQPAGMQWLTFSDADRIGLDVKEFTVAAGP